MSWKDKLWVALAATRLAGMLPASDSMSTRRRKKQRHAESGIAPSIPSMRNTRETRRTESGQETKEART